MIVANLTGIKLYPVSDRGVPNMERVVIYVDETTDMGQYGIMIGQAAPNKTARPYQDYLYWFNDAVVNKGDWILLYTGKGKASTDEWKPTSGNIYSIHWGRDSTVFMDTNVVPILFRVDAVDVDVPPTDQPQIGLEKL